MKIICSKSNLLNGVNIVLKAIPANTTMSILNCILIDASQDIIKLTANDGDLGIETIIEGEILEKGKMAIDAKIFSEVVRKLPDDDTEINCDKDYKVSIKCKKAFFELMGENGDSFSYLPSVEKNENISLSQLTLKDLIRQTTFSIGVGDTNKIMGGIHVEINENVLRFSSLDGHRISIRKVNLQNSYSKNEAIIPGKAFNEISKILSGGADDNVDIYISTNHVLFEFNNTKVVSRLIEGKYFDVDKMISKEYDTKIVVCKKDLYECIDRTMLFSKEGNKKPVVFSINDENLKIIVKTPSGSLDEDIEIRTEGRNIDIGFNPKFVSDALKVIDDEFISIHFLNTKAPCYIKDDEENYIYIVLPINLNNN